MLYEIQKNEKLSYVKTKKVLERDVQNLIGKNLENLMSLKFVEFEFSVEKKRIDILAFDEESNSPVIIELKRENSEGLFDQGMEYFNLLSNRKSDFMLKFHEKLGIPADLKKINWENSKIIFIGKNFTPRQKRAVDFHGLPIELWSYEWFENGFFVLEREGMKKQAKLDIAGIGGKSEKIAKISREFKEYSIDDRFKLNWEESREIYDEISKKIFNLDNRLEEKPNKEYVAFKIGKYNLCSIHIYKSKIKLHLNRVETEDLKDFDKKLYKIPWKKNGSGKHCGFIVKSLDDIDYAMFLIKQVYEKFYK